MDHLPRLRTKPVVLDVVAFARAAERRPTWAAGTARTAPTSRRRVTEGQDDVVADERRRESDSEQFAG
jgi:hypothetical protein